MTGYHGNVAVSATTTVLAGPHQIVVEYFNSIGTNSAGLAKLTVTFTATNTDVSSSFMHDPAGPCNADCAACNTAQQYCTSCSSGTPVGGVCLSASSVTP